MAPTVPALAPCTRTYEADELRRAWKKCSCPIYASGTLGGRFKRKNTERPNWQEAKAVARQWELAGQWDENVAPAIPSQPVPAAPSQRDGITIERAITAFLAEHAESLARNTQRKYRTILKKFKEHSATKGYVMIDQWTPIDVRELRASWGVSPATSTKNMSSVKAFFEFALSNE
jgi:integrase/recombinase XerD